MPSTRSFEKSDDQYSVLALGATWFVLLAFIVALATRVSLSFDGISDWRGAFELIDGHLAALVTAASLLLFSGLWSVKPETPFGRHLVRAVIALLVVVNWAAWCVALWLH